MRDDDEVNANVREIKAEFEQLSRLARVRHGKPAYTAWEPLFVRHKLTQAGCQVNDARPLLAYKR
jgi:hypothetical protein